MLHYIDKKLVNTYYIHMLLDKIDTIILNKLRKEPLHPSELSRMTKLPRTTIAYRLKRLKKQKIVVAKTQGRKVVWHISFKPKNNNAYKEYSGDDFEKAYVECLKIRPNSIILSVQGARAASNEVKNVSRSLVFKFHERFKKKNIIFKSISNTKLLSVFKEIDSQFVQSHIGRTGGLKLFKNDLFLGDGEIAVCKEFVLIANPKSKTAVVLKEKELVMIFYQTLALLFDSLDEIRNLNLNEYLKKITEQEQV